MTNLPPPFCAERTMNQINMALPTSALAESLAVAEGNLALFWDSSSHRDAYMATARALIRPLEVRGWALARIEPQSSVPSVSP